jgi:hypothetical protein
MYYKCVPAPKTLVIDKSGSNYGAVRSFADLINREASGGWNFHSMENIAVTQKVGCLAALFGQKEMTTYFNMLVFSRESQITEKAEVFQATHIVKLLTKADGLSLRNDPDGNLEAFYKIPNGTEVQYLEQGDPIELNGIKGFWYKVKTGDGQIGWCFSGSLVVKKS